ncbi:MAG: efflux RND transporter permease subunit [Myxococcaceae bacterium]|nr:efflux RND transporter permease subunit [Myxococcaceae bacterium]
MKLTDVCINRPVFAWMLMLATVLFGVVAGTRIGISQFPDVDFPNINVRVTWEGASPEVMEGDVVEPLEEALSQVEGVRTIESRSEQGSANITIELDLDRDVDAALQDVQSRVSQAQRRLPTDIDAPVISKTNPEDSPIMWIGLSGPFSRQLLADVARYRVKEKLQTVPGVGEVAVGGSIERNVRIWIDADKLDARALTVSDVITALQRQHVELPAGRLESDGREVTVRVLGEALDLETLRQIVIRQDENAPVRLSDVALVEDGFEDLRRLTRVDGNPAQGLGIRKQRGSNAVAVSRGVRAVLAELQKTLPEGMRLDVNFDSTQFIEESVAEIELELLLAVVLTALVCWMFLGSFSATLNVILAIPMSLLGTVACIYFFGFTLNTFTLLALSLAVGLVVDDAIMVLENIFRHAEMGKDRVRAAREGTTEISFAALAATLAVIAIFLPVVFMQGVIGRFFLQFGVTLAVAVGLSYLEAMTLAPARSAQILKVGKEHRGWLGSKVDAAFDGLARAYRRLLGGALRHPWKVLGAMAAVLVVAGFVFTRIPAEMVPSQDQSRLMVRLQFAVSSDINETDRLTRQAEAVIAKVPEVEQTFTVVGGFGGSNVNQTVFFLTLTEPDQRTRSQAEVGAALRKSLNALPGVRAVVVDLSQRGFTASRGFPIEFSVRGSDFQQLVEVSEQLRQKLSASGLVTDLDSDYKLGAPELVVVPDRDRASDLGVSSEDIATTLQALVGGIRVGKYSTGGRRVDVRARLLASQRTRPEDISRLKVRTASGELVPLSSLVKQEERPALMAIQRKDRERAVSLYGNVAPGHAQAEVLQAVEALQSTLPNGVHLKLEGQSVAFRESMGGLVFALLLGIAVAYMVLASQFNSFLHPVTVLTILVPSVAGAAFALYFTGQTLNIFSMIGLLLLLGIVKKNSIILVDYATQMREQGHDAVSAMLQAGPVRLRPILMTSIATMMAAIPSALGLGAGSETRVPMAIAVIGGLVVSTALSLLVVPAFYVVADRIASKLKRRKGGLEQPAPAHEHKAA